MAKNNKLINQYKMMFKKIKDVTPSIYAALALALHRKYGWGYKRINDLFMESERIWIECADNCTDMIKMCYEETQIEVQGRE